MTATANSKSIRHDHFVLFRHLVKLRLYKNDSIQSKNIPALKLPRFFTRRMGDENLFSTEWRFSYIVLGHTKDKDGST